MTTEPIKTITLLLKAPSYFGDNSFSKEFLPAHFTSLLALASSQERTDPDPAWLQAREIAYRAFISERYARKILNDLVRWNLSEVRDNKARGCKEYHIDYDGIRLAYGETCFSPGGDRTPWLNEVGE